MIMAAIVFVVLVMFTLRLFISEVNKEGDKYKVKIGETFVFEKDTVTIIDYSLTNETFTFSNGKQVNSNFVFNRDSLVK